MNPLTLAAAIGVAGVVADDPIPRPGVIDLPSVCYRDDCGNPLPGPTGACGWAWNPGRPRRYWVDPLGGTFSDDPADCVSSGRVYGR